MEDLRAAEEETKTDLTAGEQESNPPTSAGDFEPEANTTIPSPDEQQKSDEVATASGVREETNGEGEITLLNSEPSATPEVDVDANVKEPSTPRKRKKSSKGPLKMKVVLLDGKSLDLEEGVRFF